MMFNTLGSRFFSASTFFWFKVVSVSLLFLSTNSFADSSQDPTLVSAPVEKVFIPLGFDTNDNVEVVVHGHFPSTCYKVGPSTATVDAVAKTVTIQSQAYEYPGLVCAQVRVPFVADISLGLVKEGEYRVQVTGFPDLVTDPLVIGAATTANPDDYLYAPVEQSSIEKNSAGEDFLKIEGMYPYMFVGCMNIKEVRVRMAPGQVIVVQPIAEILEDRFCSPLASKKFSIQTPIDFPLTFSEYLIHVRTLSGTSVNRFIELGQ
jgi:hypothetical protein